jgi:hypothetical protein
VLAPETISLLESGCGVNIGTGGPDGAPHASRGGGSTGVSFDPPEVRLLLEAADTLAASNLEANGRVAVTGSDVATLQSIQFKGQATAVEPATGDDLLRAAQYTDEFFGRIAEIDGTPLELLEGLRATDYVASHVRIAELYDQTPGPSAGTRLPGPTP